jgi:hypothetical protein
MTKYTSLQSYTCRQNLELYNFIRSTVELMESLDYQHFPSWPIMLETGKFASRVRYSRDAGQLTGKSGRPVKTATVGNPTLTTDSCHQ